MPPTRLIAAALLAAVLLVPSPADAKELSAVKVCGADRCVTFHDHSTLQPLAEGGAMTSAPQHRAPFYTMRITVKDEGASDHHWSQAYLPSAGLIRAGEEGDYSWLRTTPAGRPVFARVTRGLAPFPAGKLPRVAPETAPDQASVTIPPAPAPKPRTAAVDTGGGFPWALAALVAAAGAGTAGAALARRRRRWGDAPHTPAAG
jgi:hypothetical protein